MVIGKNTIGCALALILTILLLCSGVLLFVAKTGVVHVPLFSAAYHGPTPTRLISAQPITMDAFRVMLGSRFFNQVIPSRAVSKGSVPKEFRVRVTEKELTGVVMNAIDATLRSGGWRQSYAQIVVRPTDVELFGQFQSSWQHIDLLARFVPTTTADGIRFDPSFVQIGDIPLSPSFAYRMASSVFSRDVGTWSGSFGAAKIRNIQLSDGVIELIASP